MDSNFPLTGRRLAGGAGENFKQPRITMNTETHTPRASGNDAQVRIDTVIAALRAAGIGVSQQADDDYRPLQAWSILVGGEYTAELTPLSVNKETREFRRGALSDWSQPLVTVNPKYRRLLALMEAAESAEQWLCDTAPGTDQHERGQALRKALIAFRAGPTASETVEAVNSHSALVAERDRLRAALEATHKALRSAMDRMDSAGMRYVAATPEYTEPFEQARAALKGGAQ